jgi:hypothetical protein
MRSTHADPEGEGMTHAFKMLEETLSSSIGSKDSCPSVSPVYESERVTPVSSGKESVMSLNSTVVSSMLLHVYGVGEGVGAVTIGLSQKSGLLMSSSV